MPRSGLLLAALFWAACLGDSVASPDYLLYVGDYSRFTSLTNKYTAAFTALGRTYTLVNTAEFNALNTTDFKQFKVCSLPVG